MFQNILNPIHHKSFTSKSFTACKTFQTDSRNCIRRLKGQINNVLCPKKKLNKILIPFIHTHCFDMLSWHFFIPHLSFPSRLRHQRHDWQKIHLIILDSIKRQKLENTRLIEDVNLISYFRNTARAIIEFNELQENNFFVFPNKSI